MLAGVATAAADAARHEARLAVIAFAAGALALWLGLLAVRPLRNSPSSVVSSDRCHEAQRPPVALAGRPEDRRAAPPRAGGPHVRARRQVRRRAHRPPS